MNITEAIQQLTDLQKKHPDIDVAFDVQNPEDPDSPLGNDFVELKINKDERGFFAVFATRPTPTS